MERGPHETGVWLVLGGSLGSPSTASFTVQGPGRPHLEPVSSGECLTLAAVLASGWSRDAAGLFAALRATRAGQDAGDTVVSRWLDGRGWAAEVHAKGASPLPVVERLCHDLRFATTAGTISGDELARQLGTKAAVGGDAAAALPVVEASILAGVLGQLCEHLRLRDEFSVRLRDGRLEALQQLAYGAGHEINNPLANIAARGQSLLRDERDAERRRRLATIVDQAFRARDMIGGLMVYAKPPTAVGRRMNVGELVDAVIRSVAEAPTAAGVRIEYRPLPEPAWAWGDGDLVAEALRAVVVNALQAVDEGGRVELAVEPVAGAESMAIAVTDDGPGLTGEQVARVTDPFFCGREAGRGLGIGLSKAWALTRACGGLLSLRSRPGHGTAVRIELPTRELSERLPA